MSPEDKPPDETPGKPNRPLPAELHFFLELPKLFELDAEEMAAGLQEFLKKAQQHRDRLRQYGVDADALIKQLEHELPALDVEQKKLDEADQNWVQALADQADAIRAAIDALELVALKKIKESPFDREVQELQAQVQELRKLYPRFE